MVVSTLNFIATVFRRFVGQSNLTADISAREFLDLYGCNNYYQKVPETVKNPYFGVFRKKFFETS